MLDVTPDSFVFLYGTSGVSVAPAVSVVALSDGPTRDPYGAIMTSVREFFIRHFESFIGDRFISSSKDDLEETLEKARAQRALLVEASR